MSADYIRIARDVAPMPEIESGLTGSDVLAVVGFIAVCLLAAVALIVVICLVAHRILRARRGRTASSARPKGTGAAHKGGESGGTPETSQNDTDGRGEHR